MDIRYSFIFQIYKFLTSKIKNKKKFKKHSTDWRWGNDCSVCTEQMADIR